METIPWEQEFVKWFNNEKTPVDGCLKLPTLLQRQVQLVCMQAVSDCPLIKKHEVEVRTYGIHDLDRQVDTDKPMIVFDRGPGESAVVCSVGSVANLYTDCSRYRVLFEKQESPEDCMDIAEVATSPGKLTKQIYWQIQHNLLEPLLRSAESHAEEMKVASTWWVLRMLDGEFKAEFYRRKFLFEVFCWGMFALSIVGQEKVGVSIFKAQ